MIDVLDISPEAFSRSPQVGRPLTTPWPEFVARFATPYRGTAKGERGGYSPALYQDNVRRKSSLIRVGVLVVDVDGDGSPDVLARANAGHACLVHTTFSSTADQPRSRVLYLLDHPVDAATYEALHRVVRLHLRHSLGAQVDDGAKDASRLSYWPVRPAGADYEAIVTSGQPLAVAAILAANPPPVRPAPSSVPASHASRYLEAALRRAAEAVCAAPEGARHETLCREAYALARLALSDEQIAAALVPAARQSMGEARRREAERTVADALRARRRS